MVQTKARPSKQELQRCYSKLILRPAYQGTISYAISVRQFM